MKARNLKSLLQICTLSILLFSCKDKDTNFVQVKSIETEIYNSIKSYRESRNLILTGTITSPFFWQKPTPEFILSNNILFHTISAGTFWYL